MFDTIADMLRGSAPDDLAHALGTDRTQTRRAMEIGLPALITGLRDKTLEPGGAQNLASMLGESSAAVPDDLDAYLAAGDPSQGAAMLDVAFGDRGEPALAALSAASGLSTRLLAQVMSVLAPLATGTVASFADRSPEGMRAYLGDAVGDLEAKGFGRVVELVSPASPAPDNAGFAADVQVDDAREVDFGEPDEIEFVVDEDLDLPSPDLVAADLPEIELPDADVDLPDLDNEGIIVEGAFPSVGDPDLSVRGLDVDLGDATEPVELGGAMPDFGADVARVAPAGIAIAGDAAAPSMSGPGSTITYADPQVDLDTDVAIGDGEIEGEGLSGMGWLWWLIGAVLGIIILFLLISQCGGSDGDGDDPVASTGDETPAATATPDPLVVQRQATLDGILVDYPNVQGEVFGDVAVLNGTVPTEVDVAQLDQEVRAAGLGAQNNVTSEEAAGGVAVEGFSLNELIDAQPELSTLRTLLDQAGFAEALGGNGEFTLFAPTNDAFEAISAELAALQGDPEGLKAALRYHLLLGSQNSTAISAVSTLPTQLEGQSISVDASSGTIVLNGTSQVLVGDAAARNGVMHIVSSVLLAAPVVAELPDDIGAELALAPITFSSGGSDLTDVGRAELDKLVAFLLENPGNIQIAGHTDSDGDSGFNLTLSQERADAVKSYLADQGIPAESMTAVGFGEDQPIAANDTAENKAMNRRIVFSPN